jgi:hypothetical protein
MMAGRSMVYSCCARPKPVHKRSARSAYQGLTAFL